MAKYGIGYLDIERYLFDVEKVLWRYRFSVDTAHRYVDALYWYVNTGRASAGFLRKMVETKPFIIARVLLRTDANTGNYDRVIDAIKGKIGF